MADQSIADLQRVDRDVARAAAALTRWRRALASDPDAHANDDPFEPVRWVAGQSTYVALGELAPIAHEVPLRDGLRRWTYALIQARLSRELDVAWARAACDAQGRFVGEAPRRVSWRDAWRGIVGATSRGEQSLWLDAAVDVASPLAAIANERATRRQEVAERLGAASADAPLSPTSGESLQRVASALLARTDDVANAVLREARVAGTSLSPLDAIRKAVAREAGEGWPARSSSRWLEELFGAGVRGLSLDLSVPPAPLGASSFARALAAFGFALRIAGAPRGLPFALAHDPLPVSAHRFALLFATLPSAPAFHARALGVSRRVALDQARMLARTSLIEARASAMRMLMHDARARDRFEELTTRVYGAPLPASLAGAWPAHRDDEPARFAALVTTQPLVNAMVELFDVDWFVNPRALPHLRAIAATPMREPDTIIDADAVASSLARAFEGALA